jgi:hypothetical protein
MILSAPQQMDANVAAGRDRWYGIANHATHAGWGPGASESRAYASFVARSFGTYVVHPPQPARLEFVPPTRDARPVVVELPPAEVAVIVHREEGAA